MDDEWITCAECGEEFIPGGRHDRVHRYCSVACRNLANRENFYRRGENPVVMPAEYKQRKGKSMTDIQFETHLKKIRVELDARPRIEGDRHWRKTKPEEQCVSEIGGQGPKAS